MPISLAVLAVYNSWPPSELDDRKPTLGQNRKGSKRAKAVAGRSSIRVVALRRFQQQHSLQGTMHHQARIFSTSLA